MDATEAIATILTIRESDDDKLAAMDTVKKILEAARLSPNARNLQPWALVVVTDRKTIQRISEVARTGKQIANSSFCVVIVTDPENRWSTIDATGAIQNIAVQAWDLGMGSCWVRSLERDQLKELLNIPKNLEILTVMPFGLPTRR